MAIKRPTKAKSLKRSNPAWLDKLFGKKTKSKDGTTIEVLDGVIFISGKKFKEIDSELYEILEKDLKRIRIEFQPNDSKRKYILNREKDKEDILDEDDVRAKRRSSILARRGREA